MLPRILFLDACVLYPTQTRDLFMRLALEGLVRLKWSQRVQEEWIRNFLQKRPDLGPEQVERVRAMPAKMEAALKPHEPLVEGYEHLVAEVHLPDEDDCHVVAAAHWGGAEAILTFNLHDFPEEDLARFDLVALHPDAFLVELADALIRENAVPGTILKILRNQRGQLRNPPLEAPAFLESLRKAGLTAFARLLRAFASEL
ncbi:PIN domain-containing protein [Thermus brockianus]|uniref:PIN domain-containing protein n=1 Tax=Thermus brockianus TaxID=56956 RepID=A0ABN6NG52_THEBO|nr:PIN domain-containing protein [Thermus brockianus]BDG16570.1 hypothetical protein TbrSNM41_13040 [Thermus brockianus]